ncbi:FHA domain-containing protein [Paenibacillus sp. yr247]|uniref:DUF6382 domain-containing protein n=1 Tax=Paenibacillus sp. yr247 TaxID=1761880 RepID=UPI00088E5547|nr:DUF6382 domain-containing protein [Paenibacillus sp. yr247]SDN82014.1 FHA domain-containing protein [Paenibacillus sp. yr247]
MTQEVFGLRYEFVYRHGHYMELNKEAGLDSKELSALQVKMLEANHIPKLLPLEIQEVDFRISLLYNLSAKRMLAHVLRVEGVSKHQFAKLMYAIVCALEESKNYMLYETGYVLKDNFIFIGSEWSDVYLTYVPLETITDEVSVFTSLEALMIQLSLKMKDDERKEVDSWLASISQIQSLQEYKESLLTHMDELSSVQEVLLISNPEIEQNQDEHSVQNSNTQAPYLKDLGLPKSLWNRNEVHRPVNHRSSIEMVPMPKNVAMMDVGGGLPISLIPLDQRMRLIVLAVVILIAAFLWQNYFSYPSAGTLQITAGISILLADVWFVSKYLGIPCYKKGSGPKLLSSNEAEQQVRKLEPPTLTSEPINIQNYYQNLHMHTTLLSNNKPNATVFLGRVMKQPLGPRFEIQIEGLTKNVPLKNDPFTIGRGGASLKVDYVLEEAGVSRVHAEIVKNDEGYVIKDTGSTNGTYLNGEPLVTYQSYPLKDGDELRIVRHEMKFRLEG